MDKPPAKKVKRCGWCLENELYIKYHDSEWGVPLHDDTKLFELLVLEGAQAGLSWLTVLKKREHYRKAFNCFDPEKIACYDERKIQSLLENPLIIRNRRKVFSLVQNARALLKIQEEFPSFSSYLWGFVGSRPIRNHFKNIQEIPSRNDISDKLSKDLKKRGFSFVGPTICYAFMQSSGMVNDHLVTCFRYAK